MRSCGCPPKFPCVEMCQGHVFGVWSERPIIGAWGANSVFFFCSHYVDLAVESVNQLSSSLSFYLLSSILRLCLISQHASLWFATWLPDSKKTKCHLDRPVVFHFNGARNSVVDGVLQRWVPSVLMPQPCAMEAVFISSGMGVLKDVNHGVRICDRVPFVFWWLIFGENFNQESWEVMNRSRFKVHGWLRMTGDRNKCYMLWSSFFRHLLEDVRLLGRLKKWQRLQRLLMLNWIYMG